VPHTPRNIDGARAQPLKKARRLGSSDVRSHPGSAEKVDSMYCARSGPAGGFGAGFSGSCWQAAISRIATSERNLDMWVVYLEMALALLIAALIIWFTWPRKKK
jgi:hypothetical protein